MAFTINCADAGQDCPAAFTTETQEELLEHIEMHATRAHPDMKLDAQAREQIKGLVKTV